MTTIDVKNAIIAGGNVWHEWLKDNIGLHGCGWKWVNPTLSDCLMEFDSNEDATLFKLRFGL
jgi:hypothetical protein